MKLFNFIAWQLVTHDLLL